MTVAQIKALVLSADPEAKHYHTSKQGDAFTVWGEYERTNLSADDRHDYGWRFEIDHYTRDPEDEVADRIEQALSEHPGVAFSYQVMYDHTAGYVRHVFDCEGT